MSWFSRNEPAASTGPILEIDKLDVYYGRAHALQEVSLSLPSGVLAVVGRNGMGKTTLCNAITGLVSATGSIRLHGEEIRGLTPNLINRRGIGFVPQGRRVWPSLTVDEHLRLVSKGFGGRRGNLTGTGRAGNAGAWTVQRIYATFPLLAERKSNGGAQLSGGEQQMLAISRALLFNPKLLVMDEPTEGLAPVIVQQVTAMLKTLASDGDISILLIEQNLGVAIDIADNIAIMVNGRIARTMPAHELAADRQLQQQLLGVRSGGEDEEQELAAAESTQPTSAQRASALLPAADGSDEIRVFTIKRAAVAEDSAKIGGHDRGATASSNIEEPRTGRGYNRWNAADPTASTSNRRLTPVGPKDALLAGNASVDAHEPSLNSASNALSEHNRDARVLEFPVAANSNRAAYIVGTFDTKGRELVYLRSCIEKLGLRTVTVDLATSGRPSPAMVHPREVARHHPRGERAVFTNDRGSAVAEMAVAFEQFVARRRDIGGMISAGGSGGTALATAAMRSLPIGVPKVMVSSVASGDVKPYVGPSDICMMYSVTDISGINRISERVLANAAHALAGMVAHGATVQSNISKPAVALTMFGVTTTCVQQVTKLIEEHYDCLVFHATGTGGQSMEKLVDSKLISAVLDITTTEVCDEIAGGVFSAGPERFDAIIRSKVPYVASCGALDMVNFSAMDTVPARYRSRLLYKHNSNVTLMRTTPAECVQIGKFIVDKLNRMDGPVRFLIPERGMSAIDIEGGSFWDPVADKALFDTIASNFRATRQRKLIRLPLHVNDPQFADALVANFREILSSNATPNNSDSKSDSSQDRRTWPVSPVKTY